MARRKKNKENQENAKKESPSLHPDIKKTIFIIVFLALAVLFILAALNQAGPVGVWFYKIFKKLFGWGYYLFPIVSFLLAFSLIAAEKKKIFGFTLVSAFVFLISGLGFIDIISPGRGGLTGIIIGSLKTPFGTTASLVITSVALIISFLVILNRPLKINFAKPQKQNIQIKEPEVNVPVPPPVPAASTEEAIKTENIKTQIQTEETKTKPATAIKPIKNYVPPPLSLLNSSTEKPIIGDLRANANIIKRALESFGISVEMGEINVGPTVTRYTLKPAEGVKLTRITALNQDLALALAAHPIRIEAPIPGKSLVGIEVPNKAAALVRLGSLFSYPEFQKSEILNFTLGRNVSGEPVFANIDKMPHLLIAGATGSGKSIMIHTLLISLLYKNSPEMLKLILIDPKRVELSVYDGIPHLMAPVITENKKAIGVLRWAIQEMDRRYELLLQAGARDIKSYNKSEFKIPYLLIVIDELADLMTSYGREVEGSIIRLTQMSRATGIHLVVSTQRPSVEVITGLIKANITSRIALQVASQVDSRTILDTAGAEKLLGHGDLLFISSETSKPRRIQGAYVNENEVKKVAEFIAKNNETTEEKEESVEFEAAKNGQTAAPNFENYNGDEDDDELYKEALEIVQAAQKASASLLQRRLKIGYARAARILDMMEEKGIIGPGDGAKPREIL